VLRAGGVIEHSGIKFEVLRAPGHDRGEIVLYQRSRRCVFAGGLVQGGMDSYNSWPGLFTDVASQRRSLRRIAELKHSRALTLKTWPGSRTARHTRLATV
jgi:glyoxylase-like metal-dependent hydrolase (beta-lactamase superfamily II)